MDIFADELEKLNKEQKNVVTFEDGKAVCIAGPGSGKTRVIVLRAMRLLVNCRKKAVLTLAYNKTAAEEMRTRSDAFIEKFFQKDAERMKKCLQFTTIHVFCY